MKLTLGSGAVWCTVWLALNISTTLVNKGIFTFLKFPFPISVSLIHMTFTAAFSLVSIQLMGIPTKALTTRQHIQVGLFSMLFCMNIVVGNLSINFTSVAMSQVIRSSIPGFTMLLSYQILGKTFSSAHVFTVGLVIVGVALATYGDLEFTWVGFILTVTGCVLSSLKSITTSIFLVGDLKFHPMELILRMSSFAIPQMVILAYLYGETHKIFGLGPEQEGFDFYPAILAALAVNGIMAFSLNFSNFMFTKSTSALTVTVAGSVKNVLTIVLSVLVFSTPITLLNSIGTVVTIAGASAYNAVNYRSKQAATAAPLPPKA